MLQYLYLIIVLSFTLAGDSLFNVAIIWRVLAQGGSAKTLGLFLCLVTILIFILQEFSGKFKKLLQSNPQRSFTWVRITGVISSLGFLPLLWRENTVMLYLAGMIFAILSFLTMITVEAIMGEEVLHGRLSSNKASRILQTAIQISAFLGASIAGFVLSIGNMKSVLIVNAMTYASGALFFILLSRHIKSKNNIKQSSNDSSNKLFRVTHTGILWVSLIGLAILTLQISAFNFLVPFISQYEKAWTATEFGYIDAAAGLGAFFCTFVMTERGYLSYIWLFSFIGILIGDCLFRFLNNPYYVAVGVFFLGFFVNAFRIKLREFMYESVSSTNEILLWTGRMTAMNAFIKAVSPLALAFITLKPTQNFMILGFLITLCFILIEVIYFTVSGTYRNKTILQNLNKASFPTT